MKKITLALIIIAGAALAAKNQKQAMDGYCPVAYVEMNQAIKGDAQYQSKAGHQTYVFANAGAKKMFDANPKKYTNAIQYGTFCATAMSMGKKLPSDMTIFSNHNGKTYFFPAQMQRPCLIKTRLHLWARPIRRGKKSGNNPVNFPNS